MGGFVIWFVLWHLKSKEKTFYYLPKWRSQTYLSTAVLVRTAVLFLGLILIFSWAYFSRVGKRSLSFYHSGRDRAGPQ